MFHHQTDKSFVQYNDIIVPTRSLEDFMIAGINAKSRNSAILKYLKFSKVPQIWAKTHYVITCIHHMYSSIHACRT